MTIYTAGVRRNDALIDSATQCIIVAPDDVIAPNCYDVDPMYATYSNFQGPESVRCDKKEC